MGGGGRACWKFGWRRARQRLVAGKGESTPGVVMLEDEEQYQRQAMMKEEKKMIVNGRFLGAKRPRGRSRRAARALVYVRASVLRTWHRYCEEGPYSVWAAANGLRACGCWLGGWSAVACALPVASAP